MTPLAPPLEAAKRTAVYVPPDSPQLDHARDVLRRTFGHADFRGMQAGVINEILAGHSAIATNQRQSLAFMINVERSQDAALQGQQTHVVRTAALCKAGGYSF